MHLSGSEIRKALSKENSEFKQLYETHQSYESRLNSLNELPYHSEQEEIEMMELKKKKLVLKDQMQLFVGQYKPNVS